MKVEIFGFNDCGNDHIFECRYRLIGWCILTKNKGYRGSIYFNLPTIKFNWFVAKRKKV